MKLENIKWERFCLEYAKNPNASEAYRKSGYKAKSEGAIYANANRLLKNDKVKARLAELHDEMASEKIANAAEIQERLTRILRGEETEEVIVVENIGDFMSEARTMPKKPNLKDVIKAGETLAKMQGTFDNNVNINLSVPVIGGEDDLVG